MSLPPSSLPVLPPLAPWSPVVPLPPPWVPPPVVPSAHDINRVYFTTSADAEDLLFLSPELFKDDYEEAAVAAEGKVLEEREKYGQEELPPGAHKAN